MLSAVLVLFGVLLAILLTQAQPSPAADSWLIRDYRGSIAGNASQQSDPDTYAVFNSQWLPGWVVRADAGGWRLEPNGEKKVAIKKVSAARYVIGSGKWRASRTSKRWNVERLSGGAWKLTGWAPRGCPGAVAVGAGRLLLASGPVPIPVRSWDVRSASGKAVGTVAEMEEGGEHAEVRPLPYYGYPRGWVWISGTSATVNSYRDGVFQGQRRIDQVSATEWRFSDGDGQVLHEGGEWVAYKKVYGGWHRVASAPAGCMGPYVLGAARLLAW